MNLKFVLRMNLVRSRLKLVRLSKATVNCRSRQIQSMKMAAIKLVSAIVTVGLR